MDYSLAIFVGRFQPVHNAHLAVIRQGLTVADKVLIIIGSAYAAPNIKNPFTAQERQMLIVNSLSEAEAKRVKFEYVRDYYYNENAWVTDVQRCAKKYYNDGDSVALLGSYKDSSSYYLKLFPQFEFIAAHSSNQPINSTDIRKAFLSSHVVENIGWTDRPSERYHINDIEGVTAFVMQWLNEDFAGTERHQSLIKEYEFIQKYKEQWASAPYTPTFVTADAIVIKSGHVLLIKRKFHPGKDLLALPGGFLKQDETLETCAIRELKEETGIRVDKPVLRRSIKAHRLFDHPNRSLRGRTITTAFVIDLGEGELPEVRSGDDAAECLWVPFMDLGRLEPEVYEDHLHLVNWGITKI